MCSSYEIEEHRGPCRCKCLTKSCHYNKDFDRENCECRCKSEFAALKRECATTGRTTRQWDEETCNCRCKPRVCVEGHYQDTETCDCKPVESTCSAVGVRNQEINSQQNSVNAQLNGASKYIGLTCVALLATIVLIFVYLLITRRRVDHPNHHAISSISHNGLPPGLDAGSIASLTGTLRGSNQSKL